MLADVDLGRRGHPRPVPGIIIRPLGPADAEPISALYGVCIATETGIGPVSAESWTDTVRLPQFGGGRDFLVAMDGASLIGLAESSLRKGGTRSSRMIKIIVASGHRRRHIGTALLRAVLEQGPEDRSLVLEGFARADWQAGIAFLNRYGFVEVEAEIAMRRETLSPGRDPPAGLLIRSVLHTDTTLECVASIHNEAYRNPRDGVLLRSPQRLLGAGGNAIAARGGRPCFDGVPDPVQRLPR